MKLKIYQIVLLLGIALMVACNNEWVQPTDDYAKGYAVCSIDAKLEIPQTNIGDTLIFYDLSMGVVDRLWDIPHNATLIEGQLTEDYISLTFNTSEVVDVTLNSTMVGDVEYTQTFTINVLEELQANFYMSYFVPTEELDDNGDIVYDEVILDTLSKFEMEAAQYELKFASIGPGTPYYYDWVLDGSAEERIYTSSDSTAYANYYVEGVYDVMLITSRTSPWGCDTVFVKDFLTITTPTSPVTVRSIEQNSSDQIVVSFTSAMPTPVSTAVDEFVVNRNGDIMTPTAITLNPDNITQYLIDIDGGMWNGDDVTVSYEGESVLGLAGNELSQFTDYVATPLIVNLITNGDMESDDLLPVVYSGWDEGSYTNGSVSEDIVHTGTRSYHFQVAAGESRTLRSNISADIYLAANTDYVFEYYWYGVELYKWASCSLGARSWFDFGVTWNACWVDPIGEWKLQRSNVFQVPEGVEASNSYYWEFGPDGNGIDVYLDDFAVYEYKTHKTE